VGVAWVWTFPRRGSGAEDGRRALLFVREREREKWRAEGERSGGPRVREVEREGERGKRCLHEDGKLLTVIRPPF
jgi:hypothetical protein